VDNDGRRRPLTLEGPSNLYLWITRPLVVDYADLVIVRGPPRKAGDIRHEHANDVERTLAGRHQA
jgi:hypothetical protein